MRRHISNWDRLSLIKPMLCVAALIVASPVLAASCPQGQFYRVRLDKCVSLSSPLARRYLGASNLRNSPVKGEATGAAIAGKKIDVPPEDDPPAAVDPWTSDRPPDEVDEAAWRMIPLLRAAEARWAAMVSPARAKTPPPEPWPFLSVHGPGKGPEDLWNGPPLLPAP